MTDEPALQRRFKGWVSEPNRRSGSRGVAGANILVETRRVSLSWRCTGPYLGWSLETRETGYTWSTAVVEHFIPGTGYSAMLIDVRGEVSSIIVRGRRRLADALSEAGFNVIEGWRWVCDEPHPIRATLLGDRINEVPPCIIK